MQVFYINLDSATDRRRHIEGQLKLIGLDAERLPAITPAVLPDEFISSNCNRPRQSVAVSPAELACTMSHRLAWHKIVTRNLPMALVLEDDVFLSRRLGDLLEAAGPLCSGLDVVDIETQDQSIRVGPVWASQGEISLHRLHTAVWGCGGYIITRRGAEKLLGPLTRYDIPVDHIVLDYHFGASRQLETRISRPAGVANGAAAIRLQGNLFPSSLDEKRKERHDRRMAERGARRLPVPAQSWESAILDWKERLRRQYNRTLRGIEEIKIPLY